jgi:hypothetical protein
MDAALRFERKERPMRHRFAHHVLAGSLIGALTLSFALAGAHAQTQVGPTNTAPPTISGNPTAGQTLTGDRGTWSGTGTISYAYQWLRCSSTGSSCSPIAGETGTTRTVDVGDVGSTLRFSVKATDSTGPTTVESAPTAVVSAEGQGAPINTREPSISGSAVQGQTLTVSAGSWGGATPITFAYQWLRCNASAANCVAIGGETGTSRVVDNGDVGSRLRVRVTATNSKGATTVDSNATAVVTGTGPSGPPVNTALPTISGTAAQGQTLTAAAGTWTGAATITFVYQWLRCDANGNGCAAIAGETGTSRVVAADDVGHRLRLQVTASNTAGSATAQSSATDVVVSSSGPLPDGAVKLPSGKYSIPVSSVSLPQQLVIDKVKFQPNPVRSRSGPIAVQVHISDTRGYVVRDAFVFLRSVPILTSTPPETPTLTTGWATLEVVPHADFPIRNRGHVQFFVRVRKPGENLLVGVGSRRLVQVRTAR